MLLLKPGNSNWWIQCRILFLRKYSNVNLTIHCRSFYSFRLSGLASEWQWGWSWPCFDTDLAASIVQIKLVLYQLVCIYMRKAERSVSKQGHLQPCLHSWPGTKHTTVKWPIDSPLLFSYFSFLYSNVTQTDVVCWHVCEI